MNVTINKMISAYNAGKSCKSGNYEYDAESKTFYLHNNPIVKIREPYVVINLCGWNTNTTRRAINVIASELSSEFRNVYKRAGGAFIISKARYDDSNNTFADVFTEPINIKQDYAFLMKR